MAALCPGVQYGLSSQQNFGDKKDLIFVKLTDSALRTIEEYIKNPNKFSCPSPTIKFIGGENGELSFPRSGPDQRPASFSFSISSTADMGGTFECLQQRAAAPGSLEGLGPIPHKMKIQANEDVYATTRHRMTEAEGMYKNKRTREIKPNQNDIGRKVKVKQPMSMRDSLLKVSAAPQVAPPQRTVPTPPPVMNNVHSSSNGLSNGLGSNHVSSSRLPMQQQLPQNYNTGSNTNNNNQKRPSVPDVARRPLRERLIHLLALRPYKKLELNDKIMKEGVREKKSLMSVLNGISHLKDNCFHLNSSMWEEVNENWPFYTDAERQIVRRRKPQNRTPPGGGSDGGSSTGSGQSPTSTHPGSPPQAPPAKRPGVNAPPTPPPGKRPRIAHESPQGRRPPAPPEIPNGQRRPPTDLRDAANMNPRSRESPQAQPNSYWGMEKKPTPQARVARVSPDSQTEGLPEADATSTIINIKTEVLENVDEETIVEDDGFPDYHKLYRPINNLEQRRQYKADFNADYAEYKQLHGLVEKVSRRFAELEDKLKRQDENSATYKDIRKQIVREYHETKNDEAQQRAKRRFQYLHDKLSHIKGLVAEYDKAGLCGAY